MEPTAVGAAREALRTRAPLVHCLTSTVVQTITADALLAARQLRAEIARGHTVGMSS